MRSVARPHRSYGEVRLSLAPRPGPALGTKRLRAVQITTVLLIAIVIGFLRQAPHSRVPHLAAGTMPADYYDSRYVAQPWLAYLHIVPAMSTFRRPVRLIASRTRASARR